MRAAATGKDIAKVGHGGSISAFVPWVVVARPTVYPAEGCRRGKRFVRRGEGADMLPKTAGRSILDWQSGMVTPSVRVPRPALRPAFAFGRPFIDALSQRGDGEGRKVALQKILGGARPSRHRGRL